MAGEPFLSRQTAAFIALNDPHANDPQRKAIFARNDRLRALAHAADMPFLDLSGEFSGNIPFQIGLISDAVATVNRRSLVLGGGLLEGGVSQTAVQTLLDGFNVFVPADLVVAAQDDHRGLLFDRIRDSAGVVTSERQLLLDLLAQEPRPGRRTEFEVLWAGLSVV